MSLNVCIFSTDCYVYADGDGSQWKHACVDASGQLNKTYVATKA